VKSLYNIPRAKSY